MTPIQTHGLTQLIKISNMAKDDNEKKGIFDDFLKGFKEEYEKEDKEKDKPLKDQAVDGAVTGVSETLFHPFRWLRSMLK